MLIKLKDMKSDTPIIGIYKINYPNGKIYIGQSQNIRSRIMEHNQRARNYNKDNSNRIYQKCDIKMAEQNFQIEEFEILEVTSISTLDEREKYWTQIYNSNNWEIGYNLLDKGDVSGRRGCDNVNAAFSKQDLNEIIDLLTNHTELSILDIAKKYNVDQNTIGRINTGKSYVNKQLSYPLRKNNHDASKKNNILDYFQDEKTLLAFKNELKYSWYKTIENGLEKEYNIPLNIARDINNGNKFSEYGEYSYPIRPRNQRNNKNFTIEDIIKILEQLRNTTNSMTIIGQEFKIDRSTVSKINQGLSYPIENYNYPARQTK